MKITELFGELFENSRQPREFVYHASRLPNLAKGLRSIIQKGLIPSRDGYRGPGVYFAYEPEEGLYHVDKDEAVFFRAKWKQLVDKFGVYPEKGGIERDQDEIVVRGSVPANMLEIEYFPGEWWDLESALGAETAYSESRETDSTEDKKRAD